MPLLAYSGRLPALAEDVFVAPNAYLIGEVHAADGANIWFGCVLRGDIAPIWLGRSVNIQENSVLHSNSDSPTVLGDYTVLGHNVVVHGAELGDHVLVGIGAAVLARSKVGAGSIIGAHAVVTEDAVIPAGSLVLGVPGRVVREITEKEYRRIVLTRENYDRLSREYMRALGRGW